MFPMEITLFQEFSSISCIINTHADMSFLSFWHSWYCEADLRFPTGCVTSMSQYWRLSFTVCKCSPISRLCIFMIYFDSPMFNSPMRVHLATTTVVGIVIVIIIVPLRRVSSIQSSYTLHDKIGLTSRDKENKQVLRANEMNFSFQFL